MKMKPLGITVLLILIVSAILLVVSLWDGMAGIMTIAMAIVFGASLISLVLTGTHISSSDKFNNEPSDRAS